MRTFRLHGVIDAAAIGNAADAGRADVESEPRQFARAHPRVIAPSISTVSMLALNTRSIRSVWSRERSGSIGLLPFGAQARRAHRSTSPAADEHRGEAIGDPLEAAAVDDDRQRVGGASRSVPPVCGQRRDQRVHRPLAQRLVAVEAGAQRKGAGRADRAGAPRPEFPADRTVSRRLVEASGAGDRPCPSPSRSSAAPNPSPRPRSGARRRPPGARRPGFAPAPWRRRISALWEIDLSPGGRARPRNGPANLRPEPHEPTRA